MRSLSAHMQDALASGLHVGEYAVSGRVTVEPSWELHRAYDIGDWPTIKKPVRWWQDQGNTQFEKEVPGVLQIHRDKSIDNLASTCEIHMANAKMNTNAGMAGYFAQPGEFTEAMVRAVFATFGFVTDIQIESATQVPSTETAQERITRITGELNTTRTWANLITSLTNLPNSSGGPSTAFGNPGYYSPGRGSSPEAVARWGHVPNEWSEVLVQNALIRVYQGFGGEDLSIPEAVAAGNLMLRFVGLIDSITVSTNAQLVMHCRGMAGPLLVDQQLYVPLIPIGEYPLDRRRWVFTEEEVQINSPAESTSTSPAASPTATRGDQPANVINSSEEQWGYPDGVHGHPPIDSIDGDTETFWLGVGNSRPDAAFAVDFVEYDVHGSTVNAVYLNPWGGPYTVYVSVMVNGAWQGSSTVPYDPSEIFATQTPAVDTGAAIPYVLQTSVSYEQAQEFTLPQSYPAVQRVRISFRDLFYTQWGPWHYRAGLRDFHARNNTSTGPAPAAAPPNPPPASPGGFTEVMVRYLFAYYGYTTDDMIQAATQTPSSETGAARVTRITAELNAATRTWAQVEGSIRILPTELTVEHKLDGNYLDLTDIVKDLLFWSGYYFKEPDGSTAQPNEFTEAMVRGLFRKYGFVTDTEIESATQEPSDETAQERVDRILNELNTSQRTWADLETSISTLPNASHLIGGTPSVFGTLETTGTYTEDPFSADQFDKKPVADGINTIKEIVGYILYERDDGGIAFVSPNWWAPGNFNEDQVHLDTIPEVDERVDLTGLQVSLPATPVRSPILIGSSKIDPHNPNGTIYVEYYPPFDGLLRNMCRPAMWINGGFKTKEEMQIMAELIGLHIWMQLRLDSVSAWINPAIELNDQVRIFERVTSETAVHYVRGINDTMVLGSDNQAGSWTMQLTTNWLGDGSDWAISTTPVTSTGFSPRYFPLSDRLYRWIRARGAAFTEVGRSDPAPQPYAPSAPSGSGSGSGVLL